MWTEDIVKARFIEASEIERRMVVKGISGCGNAWPTYGFDKEERNGWVQADIEAELEWWAANKATTTPEITRWEEVYFFWTPLIPERRRSLVWRFAQCRAYGRSFSKYCEEKGLIRMTAYNRLDKVFETLSKRFLLEGRLVRLPKGMNALQSDDAEALEEIRLDCDVPSRGPTIHKPYRSEKHHDNLTSPEAVAAFSKHLSSTNDARRRSQARKREKALRGVPGEQEAA